MMNNVGPKAEIREVFAERFALLHAEAGRPPLHRIEQWVLRARRFDERGRPVRVSKQRLSDWRGGRNVPARFPALGVTLEVLIAEARKTRSTPVIEQLYDLAAWRTLWETALATAVKPNEGVTECSESSSGEVGDKTSFCPYRGLSHFRVEDHDWFFGRERSTTELLSRVDEAERGGGFVMLMGASGAGKSSLLRAGLLPALARGSSQAAKPVCCSTVMMTPGSSPMNELSRHFPHLTPGEAFGKSPAADGSQRTVLIVDQFEEIFTLCDDEKSRQTFIQTLHSACTPSEAGTAPPAVVILGVRADFYGSCLDYPELADALRNRQMILESMTGRELHDAVSRPAKAVGLELEPGLADLILRDLSISDGPDRRRLSYDAGALPLLSHSLLATWQRRQAGKLTISGYRATGGIHGSVAATAERAWSQLDPAEQSAAKDVLLRLVHVGKETRDTRRRSSRSQILQFATNGVATQTVLEVLARERLLTLDAESVEITHEALLHAWPRLRKWIDQDRSGNLARQRLEEDAASWAENKRDFSVLLRGPRLETGQRVVNHLGTTVIAREFVAVSTRHQRRSVLTRRAAVAAVCVMAVAALVAAMIAVGERDDARFKQLVADADRLRETDVSLSAQMTLAAYRMRPDDLDIHSRLTSLQDTPLAIPLDGHTGGVYDTSFSPDGQLLATSGYDNEVRLWDVRDRSRPKLLGQPLTGHSSWVSTAVFSPDGRTLVTAGDDAAIRLWNVTDPANPKLLGKPLTTGNGTIYSVSFSADGSTIATANDDHTARLWDVRDPAHPVPLSEPLTGHALAVRSVVFSRNGRVLVTTGNDGTVRLWDVTNPARPMSLGKPITASEKLVHSVEISPDSQTLATAGEDNAVRLWNITDPTNPKQLGQPLRHAGPLWSVTFRQDGRLLAATSSNSTTTLWNITDPANATELGRPLTAGGQFTTEFSPDGHTLATGGADGLTRLWSIPSTMVTSPIASPSRAAYSPNSRLLAVAAGGNRTVRLWDASAPENPVPLGQMAVSNIGWLGIPTFSPDGHLLAISAGDRTVRLWNVTDPTRPLPVGQPIALRTRDVGPVAFSPDGSLLATGSDDKSVQLWRITDPAHPVPVGTPIAGHDGYVNSVAFRQGGRILATASSDNTVRLWDVADPDNPRSVGQPLIGHTSPVQWAEFSRDGHLLATASADKTVRLWNVEDPANARSTGQPLTGHTQAVKSMTFHPDNRILATAGDDKTIRLWNIENPASPSPMGLSLGGDKDPATFVVFSPDGQLLTSMGAGPVHFWDLDIERQVQRICATTRGALTPALWQQHIPQFSYDPPCAT